MNSSNEVEETAYEKELAKVMGEEWEYYKTNIVPIENQVISEALSSNDESVYNEISKNTNLATTTSNSKSLAAVESNLQSSGVDPSSGKYKETTQKLSDLNAINSAKSQTSSEVQGQNRYIDKLSNVVSMGQGEATESVSSLNDLAEDSQRQAASDSSINQQEVNNINGAIGAVGGAVVSNKLNTPSSETLGSSSEGYSGEFMNDFNGGG
jgi:hypothetical protein